MTIVLYKLTIVQRIVGRSGHLATCTFIVCTSIDFGLTITTPTPIINAIAPHLCGFAWNHFQSHNSLRASFLQKEAFFMGIFCSSFAIKMLSFGYEIMVSRPEF